MKALMLQEYNEFEFTEVAVPDLGAHEIRIAVKACGICGSDIHGMDGSSGRRVPPLIMGHEAAGVVEATGSDVARWRVGDRVTFDSMISCGTCFFCRSGTPNLCDNRRVLGVSPGDYRQHGAFAEYVVVPEHIVFELPPQISFEHASMTEPVSIALHAVNITPLTLGANVVVVGAGMIGNLVIQALRVAGCGEIIAVDLDKGKLELAQEVGATAGLVANEQNIAEEVYRLTGGRGADATFEAVGIAPTVTTAIDSVRKGGSVTLVGNLAASIDFPLQSVVTREVKVYGSCGINGEYPAALKMIADGTINVDALISAVAPLREGASWFHRLYQQEPGLMKVILQP